MRALIVLGGDAPSPALLRTCAEGAEMIIAADRGLAAFPDSGIEPTLILGDMDSVPPEVLSLYEGVPRRTLNPVKDDTDGEAAVNAAIDAGAREITLLGALGGRMDHALGNLALLVLAARRGAFAAIRDERAWIARVPGKLTLSGAKGETVSLIPLGRAEGVTLTGFAYPLQGGTLTNENTLGISNVVNADKAEVRVERGDLLIFRNGLETQNRI